MCGIAGYVDLEGAPADEVLVGRMARVLSHRGPDDSALRTLSAGAGAPTVVFGHQRLAIIDLSEAGSQPMPNEDGSIQVVYNGEIYNFAELRCALEARGHRFRSRTDTEVLVHAYEEDGPRLLQRLDGMFAFVLWDGRNRRLLMARDRAGKKPLYYSWDGRRLAFASEIKALRLCPWVDDSVAWERIPEFLTFGYVPWPHTVFRGIHQVPPGSFVTWEGGRLQEPRTYWNLRFDGSGASRRVSWDEAAGSVRELLHEAVKRRLVSDVPLGVLLSGGLDSSAIVALMSGLGVPIRTFTVGMGDEATYDERRFARLAADRFGTVHTELVVEAEAAPLLERLLWFNDQPFADSSSIPTYLIAEAARRHVTVALTGDGGDEAFGGYERFAAALAADRTPDSVQRLMGWMAGLLPRTSGYHDLRSRIERFSAGVGGPVADRYRSWIAVFDPDTLREVLSPGMRDVVEQSDPTGSFQVAWEAAGATSLLHRLLYTNFRTYLHDDLLVKTDRMTMANSLEARCPFLDTGLLEGIASIPSSMKATPFGLKRILRRAMKDLLPRTIVRRRKHGFGVPVGRWFRNDLRDPFRFAQHVAAAADHGGRLWALLSLEVWLRMLERPVESGPPSMPEIMVMERSGT